MHSLCCLFLTTLLLIPLTFLLALFPHTDKPRRVTPMNCSALMLMGSEALDIWGMKWEKKNKTLSIILLINLLPSFCQSWLEKRRSQTAGCLISLHERPTGLCRDGLRLLRPGFILRLETVNIFSGSYLWYLKHGIKNSTSPSDATISKHRYKRFSHSSLEEQCHLRNPK